MEGQESEAAKPEDKRLPPPKIDAVVLSRGIAPTGRYVRTVTVRSESRRYRDNGKVFLLTELSAAEAEEWAIDALNAMAANGVDIGNVPMSIAGIQAMGVMSLGRIPKFALGDLLKTMFKCVSIVPDPQGAPHMTRSLTDDDIQEAPTRVLLRFEVFNLHTDFLEPDAPTISQTSTTVAPGSHGIRTSHPPSAPRSHQAGRR